MRRFLAALIAAALIAAALAAAALFVPAASARPRITLRYTAVFDLKSVRVNGESLRDADVLDD